MSLELRSKCSCRQAKDNRAARAVIRERSGSSIENDATLNALAVEAFNDLLEKQAAVSPNAPLD